MDKWIESLNKCANKQAFLEVMDAYCGENNFHAFVYVVLNPSIKTSQPVFSVGNYPQEWVQMYLKSNYHLHDPVLSLAKKTQQSFVWSETVVIDKLSDKSLRVMEEAQAFNIVNGLTVPVNSLNGESFHFLCDATLDLMTHKKTMLMSYLAQEQLQQISNGPMYPQKLTARESECLIWTAAGKTSDEIGIILGITARGVNENINKAMKKLNVRNKIQAVTKALHLREFSFADIRL